MRQIRAEAFDVKPGSAASGVSLSLDEAESRVEAFFIAPLKTEDALDLVEPRAVGGRGDDQHQLAGRAQGLVDTARMVGAKVVEHQEGYWNPLLLKLNRAGLQYVLGDLKVDDAIVPPQP